MNTPILALIVVAVAGAAVALQTPINAALGRNIGSGVAAAAVSFGVGFAILLGVLLMRGELGALPRAASASPVLLLGGVLGAFYVWSVLWPPPRWWRRGWFYRGSETQIAVLRISSR